MGNITRSNLNTAQACFTFDDCDFVSQNGVPMSLTNILSLVNMARTGSYDARYALAQLPVNIPRMATMNFGKGGDPGWFFDQNKVDVLARMARGDLKWLQASFAFTNS